MSPGIGGGGESVLVTTAGSRLGGGTRGETWGYWEYCLLIGVGGESVLVNTTGPRCCGGTRVPSLCVINGYAMPRVVKVNPRS